jgi:aspartate racemase
MNKLAPAIEAAVKIPLLHIADPIAAAIRKAGLSRIGLLGTRFTMEQVFYRGRLEERHGIEVLIPEQNDIDVVHRVIYEELCLGRVEDASRKAYQGVMARLVERGAQGIILGCTEISMLVGAQDAAVPLFDTTAIHAGAAVAEALDDARMVS